MKRNFILIFLTMLIAASGFSKEKSWYKVFKGKINNAEITMHLVYFNDDVRGFYYYDKYKIPLAAIGNLTEDSLSLYAYLNNYDTELFKGVFKNGSYTGGWSKNENKNQVFSLQENTALSSDYDFVYVHGKKALETEAENPPEVIYTEGLVWPAGNSDISAYLRKVILKEKNFPQSLNSIGSRMLAGKNKFIEDYFEQNKNLSPDDIRDMGYSLTLEEHDILSIAYLDKNLAVFSRMVYSYTGGAHGNYGTAYICVNLDDRSVIQLGDIVTASGIAKLPALLEKNFREQNDVKPSQLLSDFGLFVDTIPVNDNFIITPGALVFSYVPYEIAPYAGGEVVIYIPLSDIEQFLKPEFKKLLK